MADSEAPSHRRGSRRRCIIAPGALPTLALLICHIVPFTRIFAGPLFGYQGDRPGPGQAGPRSADVEDQVLFRVVDFSSVSPRPPFCACDSAEAAAL